MDKIFFPPTAPSPPPDVLMVGPLAVYGNSMSMHTVCYNIQWGGGPTSVEIFGLPIAALIFNFSWTIFGWTVHLPKYCWVYLIVIASTYSHKYLKKSWRLGTSHQLFFNYFWEDCSVTVESCARFACKVKTEKEHTDEIWGAHIGYRR